MLCNSLLLLPSALVESTPQGEQFRPSLERVNSYTRASSLAGQLPLSRPDRVGWGAWTHDPWRRYNAIRLERTGLVLLGGDGHRFPHRITRCYGDRAGRTSGQSRVHVVPHGALGDVTGNGHSALPLLVLMIQQTTHATGVEAY